MPSLAGPLECDLFIYFCYRRDKRSMQLRLYLEFTYSVKIEYFLQKYYK